MDKYINLDRIQELLSQLISIPSPYFKEEEVMNFAYNWLKDRKVPVEYHRYYEKKMFNYDGINVIGSIKGKRQGPKILLNGHLDTVQLCEGWTRDPFKATIEGNKLYGLGAVDMKAGSAGIMIAIEAFIKTVDDFKGEILYTLVSDEEGPYGLGTDALIVDGLTEGVDVAIVTEPSSGFTNTKFPCLCLGARGGFSYTVELLGKAAHAANPEYGINAISDAAKVMMELEKSNLTAHEKLGKGSICIIGAEGGGAACSVADKASFSVFRHVVPGEDEEYVRNEVKEAIERADIQSKTNIKFREGTHSDNACFAPYVVSEEDKFTKVIQNSIKDVTGEEGTIRYFSSIGDFNYLGSRVKVPTFVFGPDGGNHHTADEYVEMDTVVDTAKVIYDFLLKVLT
jgi:succinyl-diaminopimelate desuccinylase